MERAIPHHHGNAVEISEVRERITVDKNQVRALASGNRADLAILLGEARGTDGDEIEELRVRESDLVEQLQLARQ